MIYVPEDLGLPEKFTSFRPEQQKILSAIRFGENLIVEGPPGVGKTVVGAAAQRILGAPAVYVTPNKSLQRQVADEFPHSRILMGRSNYECLLHKGLKANCCTHHKEDPCPSVEECPYRLARTAAEYADLAVLNSSVFLYISHYAGKFRRSLLIVDEADMFERTLVDFIKVEITEKDMRYLRDGGCRYPMVGMSVSEWIDWANSALPVVGRLAKESFEDEDAEESDKWKRLQGKLSYMIGHVDGSWFTEVDERLGSITFRPVLVNRYAHELVWVNHQTIILMSGTILDPNMLRRSLGLKATYVAVPCPFPVENRPVYDISKYVGNLNYKNTKELLPYMAECIEKIVDQRPDSKILVHTHSYALTRGLVALLNSDRVITHENSDDRQAVLDRFKESPLPLVLVSPSHERGLDLADDVYNVVVICKMPYGDLSSEAVQRRMALSDGGPWYRREAVSNFIQACFRGMRSDTKKCEVYVLDRTFRRHMSQFPAWFRRAIQ